MKTGMSIGAHDLAKALDYSEYHNFKPVIEKAKFIDLTEMLPAKFGYK